MATTAPPNRVPAPGGPSIGGQVRGDEGAGVGGATLTLISLTGRQLGRAVARGDGRYTMPTPGTGSYVLIASADGHRPQASTVVVGDDAEPARHDVVLTGTSGLAGTVTGAGEAQPVAGAMVVVTDVRGEVLATETSDQQGGFTFADLPAGDYVVAVNASGHRPAALPVRLTGPGVTRVAVVLSSGARLRGVVRAGADGRSLPDARVVLVDAAGTVVGTAITGPDGAYAFTDLPAGQYSLVAGGYPPVATALTVDGGATDGFDVELSHPER